jgi:hypothetical protein
MLFLYYVSVRICVHLYCFYLYYYYDYFHILLLYSVRIYGKWVKGLKHITLALLPTICNFIITTGIAITYEILHFCTFSYTYLYFYFKRMSSTQVFRLKNTGAPKSNTINFGFSMEPAISTRVCCLRANHNHYTSIDRIDSGGQWYHKFINHGVCSAIQPCATVIGEVETCALAIAQSKCAPES